MLTRKFFFRLSAIEPMHADSTLACPTKILKSWLAVDTTPMQAMYALLPTTITMVSAVPSTARDPMATNQIFLIYILYPVTLAFISTN